MMLSSTEQHQYQQHPHHGHHPFGNQYYNGNGANEQYYYSNNNSYQHHEYAQHNHYNHPPPPPPPTEQPQDPSALWLLKQSSVTLDLQRMARRLVERQRHADDPGVSPCLFVVLPKTSRGLFSASTGPNAIATVGTTAAAARANNNNSQNKGSSDEDDFWLYFLCDCDFMTPESTILNLHVCSPPATFPPSPSPSSPPSHYNNNYYKHRMSPPTITYPGGYQLRNLDKFVENNALPMLSLLYLVEQANEDPAWTDRIRGGIRFLAERCREDLWAVYQTESDRDSQQGRTPAYGDIDDSRDLNRDEDEEDMEDNVEEEGEEGEDGEKGDEEAEEGWLRLREEDFRDPYRAAGKSNSNSDSRGSGIDGINFQALDLNRDQQDNITATEQPAPEGGGGLVLGADVLCQVNFPYIEGGILWLCAAHNEMLCKGMAAAKLRDFIKAKGGHCIPMEKSAEIQLQTREDARVFYGMLDEYKCVIKLKVGFEWEGGVMEEDLWELCQTVHSSTVRDLTIDCGGGIGLGGAIGRGLTFRPMLGMMCRLGFTALTVENFDGLFLSPEEPLFTQGVGSRRSSRSNSSGNFYNSNDGNNHQLHTTSSSSGDPQFLLQELRTSPTIMALPDNIQVKKLTFRHWARVPDRRAIVNLIKVLPNLTELEAMTDSVELLYESIQEELQLQAQTAGEFRTPHNSSNYHHPLSHLNLLEVGPCGSKVKLTLSKPSGPDGAIRILDTQWKTNKAPDSRLLQSAIGLETLGFTQCVRLWEHGPALQRIVGCNYSTLRRVEIVCSTDQMANVWVFLRDEFKRPTLFSSPAAAAAAGGEGYFGRDSSLSPSGSHYGRRTSGGSDNSLQQHHQYQHRNRKPVYLRIYDRAGHILESPNTEQDNQTILHLDQYNNDDSSSFRAQLELQSQIASRLRISQRLTDLSQLDWLSRDIAMIRIQAQQQAEQRFCLYELVVCLTRASVENVGYLEAVWNLMDQLPMVALTVQMDSSFDHEDAPGVGGVHSPRPQDMPRRLLEAFARLRRVDVGRVWNELFERWMQELLVQEVFPIWKNATLPDGLPVQGGFVFSAAESLKWSDAGEVGLEGGAGGVGRASAGVVYSLTHYR